MLFTVQQPIDLAIYVHRRSLRLVKSFKDVFIKPQSASFTFRNPDQILMQFVGGKCVKLTAARLVYLHLILEIRHLYFVISTVAGHFSLENETASLLRECTSSSRESFLGQFVAVIVHINNFCF
jgi:hypothetical protein